MAIYEKSIGILVFIIIGGLLTGRVYSADIKIGWVDMQRAVNECNAGKEAKKALTKEVEKVQRLIAEKQKELQEMKGSLEQQGLMLTPEARASREKEFQTKLRDSQRWGEDIKDEFNQKRIEMERNISSGLVQVVQEIGAKEGYTVILQRNENIVLFTTKSIDLTDLVIKAYDMEKK
jgi:outer membrane protein